jgi:hypothetical protein
MSHDQLKNSTKAMFDGIRSNPKLTLSQFRDIGAQKIGYQHFGDLKPVMGTAVKEVDPKEAILTMLAQFCDEDINRYLHTVIMDYVVFYSHEKNYFLITMETVQLWCENNNITIIRRGNDRSYPYNYTLNDIVSENYYASEEEAQIAAYYDILMNSTFDISYYDLFQCQHCEKHFDIEDSVKTEHELICTTCNKQEPPMCHYRVSIFEDKGDSKHLTCFEKGICEESAEDCALSVYPNGEVKHIEAITEDEYNDAISDAHDVPCEICANTQYLVSTRDDGKEAIEACDNCREKSFTDEDAAKLAIRDGIDCATSYPCIISKAALDNPLKKAKQLWATLGNIPVNDDNETEEQFLHFDAGTECEEIWHWFENEFNVSVATDLMNLK